MLYAISVKISAGKNQRRIDLVVSAESPEEAGEKAVKQARKMYYPGKKAVYTITTLVTEDEAIAAYTHPRPETSSPTETT